MDIRSLDPADLDAAVDLRSRSLGELSGAAEQEWRETMTRFLADDQVLACYDGARLVATARIHRFGQWWHGRSLPMAGVGGVAVAPEDRGRGVGRRLMQAVLEHAAATGYALSALYPMTVPLYRGCGWEFGGVRQLVTVPAEALRGPAAGPVPVRRVGAEDAADILAVVRKVHTAARTCGPIDWPEDEVRRWLDDDEPYAYLAPDGFLAYGWEGRDLAVDELVAGSGETAQALWALVGSGSSAADTVRACIGPDDPLRWLTREDVVRPEREQRWMLRLLDVAAALAGRGYPAGVRAEVTFAVDDPQLPGNSGTWRLSVAGGAGEAERVGGGAPPAGGLLRLSAGGLGALYSGTRLPVLRAAGLATGGDPETDALLDVAFTARPYLLDYF